MATPSTWATIWVVTITATPNSSASPRSNCKILAKCSPPPCILFYISLRLWWQQPDTSQGTWLARAHAVPTIFLQDPQSRTNTDPKAACVFGGSFLVHIKTPACAFGSSCLAQLKAPGENGGKLHPLLPIQTPTCAFDSKCLAHLKESGDLHLWQLLPGTSQDFAFGGSCLAHLKAPGKQGACTFGGSCLAHPKGPACSFFGSCLAHLRAPGVEEDTLCRLLPYITPSPGPTQNHSLRLWQVLPKTSQVTCLGFGNSCLAHLKTPESKRACCAHFFPSRLPIKDPPRPLARVFGSSCLAHLKSPGVQVGTLKPLLFFQTPSPGPTQNPVQLLHLAADAYYISRYLVSKGTPCIPAALPDPQSSILPDPKAACTFVSSSVAHIKVPACTFGSSCLAHLKAPSEQRGTLRPLFHTRSPVQDPPDPLVACASGSSFLAHVNEHAYVFGSSILEHLKTPVSLSTAFAFSSSCLSHLKAPGEQGGNTEQTASIPDPQSTRTLSSLRFGSSFLAYFKTPGDLHPWQQQPGTSQGTWRARGHAAPTTSIPDAPIQEPLRPIACIFEGIWHLPGTSQDTWRVMGHAALTVSHPDPLYRTHSDPWAGTCIFEGIWHLPGTSQDTWRVMGHAALTVSHPDPLYRTHSDPWAGTLDYGSSCLSHLKAPACAFGGSFLALLYAPGKQGDTLRPHLLFQTPSPGHTQNPSLRLWWQLSGTSNGTCKQGGTLIPLLPLQTHVQDPPRHLSRFFTFDGRCLAYLKAPYEQGGMLHPLLPFQSPSPRPTQTPSLRLWQQLPGTSQGTWQAWGHACPYGGRYVAHLKAPACTFSGSYLAHLKAPGKQGATLCPLLPFQTHSPGPNQIPLQLVPLAA
ncbi:hypothetical protein TREES_T100016093 [Tupaia chinensis]|uniref:Uncharacterized protein n=1 Tax=Tupaia chinensis TaxID=246437 RepID=L9KLL9_TUPCH|nr:hypothetical protein TREES_T100016093 [Tupaia chinensis]